MKFFAKITELHNPKNKAQRALQRYVKSIHNTVLQTNEAREQFITDINIKISEINQEHPRCHDIKLSGWNFAKTEDETSIGVYGNFFMIISPVKHEK